MQSATKTPRSSAVLKLGRYVLRCLTAQPDIWFLFLYKCGQLVAVNLHEPVARSVGLLDELFPEPQSHRLAVGSSQPSSEPGGGSRASAEQVSVAPDNDQYRGMDDDDTDEGRHTENYDEDEDDDDDDCDNPYAFLTRRPRFTHSECGSSGRRSSRGHNRRRSTASSAGNYCAGGVVTATAPGDSE